MNWYEEKIEPGIRSLVVLLRDNGFNTECSCEHEMYVQCQYLMEGEIKRLHDTLFNNGFRDYSITLQVTIADGYQVCPTVTINIIDGEAK